MTQLPTEREETAIRPAETADSPPAPRQRSGCFWGFLGSLGCLAVLIILMAIPVIAVPATVANVIDNVLAPLRSRPPLAQVLGTQTIVQRIQPLGQLVNLSVQLVQADVLVGVEQGTLNACGFSANHVVQGAVEAGIDLSQLSEADLQYDEATDTYTLTLPQAQLTSCRIDYIRQYDTSTTTCSVDWDAARLMAQYSALSSFRDEQLSEGILSRAEREATLVLGSFLQVLTDSNVEIRFADGDPAAIPASCQPQVPPGWNYDANRSVWVGP